MKLIFPFGSTTKRGARLTKRYYEDERKSRSLKLLGFPSSIFREIYGEPVLWSFSVGYESNIESQIRRNENF